MQTTTNNLKVLKGYSTQKCDLTLTVSSRISMLANSELTHIFVFDGAILSVSIPSDVVHISEGGAVLTISASFFLIVATPAEHTKPDGRSNAENLVSKLA